MHIIIANMALLLTYVPITFARVQVYYNGDIITMDPSLPTAETLVVKNGKIANLGALSSVKHKVPPDAEWIDLDGKTLMPGFFDAHSNAFLVALRLMGADLTGPPVGTVDSVYSLKDRLSSHIRSKDISDGQWVLGTSYDYSSYPRPIPVSRHDLDDVSVHHPILILHSSQNSAVANSMALHLAGIDSLVPDPAGGKFIREPGTDDPSGELEGVPAIIDMFKVIPPTPRNVSINYISQALKMYAEQGITTCQEAGAAMGAVSKLFRGAARDKPLLIDVIMWPKAGQEEEIQENFDKKSQYTRGLRFGGLKLILDGSIELYTAFLSKRYSTSPNFANMASPRICLAVVERTRLLTNISSLEERKMCDTASEIPNQSTGVWRGYPNYPQQIHVNRWVELALINKWPLIVHCNGDAALDQLIQAVRYALLRVPAHVTRDHRITIVHGQVIREDQLDTIRQLEMRISFFPGQIFYFGDLHVTKFLGRHRTERIDPMRSAVDRGIPTTIHTDAPNTPLSIIDCVYFATNRFTKTAIRMGKDQEITVQEALESVTIRASEQNREEASKGSLEKGKLADLVILSENPLKIDSSKLRRIKVIKTIKKGKVVYSSASTVLFHELPMSLAAMASVFVKWYRDI